MSTELSGIMIAYIFCALPYATTFYEDIKNMYICNQIIRGGQLKYVVSKVVIIYLSAVIIMVLGSVLFISLCSLKSPWMDFQVGQWGPEIQGMYSVLLRDGRYFVYCVLYSLQLGLWAGILSISTAFLSLYLDNKVTVMVLPVLILSLIHI